VERFAQIAAGQDVTDGSFSRIDAYDHRSEREATEGEGWHDE
jgi:hypothetical protein